MKKRTTHIIVKIEVRDGEREYILTSLQFIPKGRTAESVAKEYAREFYPDGKKIAGETDKYEQCFGEVITSLEGYKKVDEADVPVLQKYFI